jgi:photosystem II stability/assembly factor-like uncharacterized protein
MISRSAFVALLASAVLAAPAAANVQVGASGWIWGNPLPQGNTLRSASFAGTTGYAVGDFGTLLKTTDGGASWTGLQVGTFTDLDVVQALDANTVFAGGGCVARRSTDGGKTFTRIAFTPVESSCRAALFDMSFVSPTTGYLLLENGTVLTTSDGGTQFAPRTAVPGTDAAGGDAHPTSLVFTSATTGFAATNAGNIYQTTDGGNGWKLVASGLPAVQQVWFLDATHGFAVGNGGLLARSDDGGTTWKRKDIGNTGRNFTSIRCADANVCELSEDDGGALVRITDGGESGGQVIKPSTDPIFAAAFASATRVVAVGKSGSTVVSDDAGATFAPVGGRLTGTYDSIVLGAAKSSAYAPGDNGALAKTSDGGHTWTTGNVPTSSDLVGVAFPTATSGYALDDDGGLFATSSGGATWKTLDTGSTAAAQAVEAPNAKTVLAIGPRGVRRSTDGGETFAAVRVKAVAKAKLEDATSAPGAVFAWGSDTLLRSTNGGASWSALPKPGANARERKRLGIDHVAFSSKTTGLVVDTAGRVWRTTDSGRHWTRLFGVGTDGAFDVATGSARTAYLLVGRFGSDDQEIVMRTKDAGATWQPELVVSDRLRDIAATGGTDYLLAGDADLLATTTGGLAGGRSTLTLSTAHKRLHKSGTITVSGKLKPAQGKEQVVVSMEAAGSSQWSHKTVTVASNGAFTTSWHVGNGTSTFVAQWTGSFSSAGAGSKPLAVLVKR